jgi:hypothetical protein
MWRKDSSLNGDFVPSMLAPMLEIISRTKKLVIPRKVIDLVSLANEVGRLLKYDVFLEAKEIVH